ncbi:MAG: tryptophan synthase subunit alpha [Alphaproteobacteria bacterium]|nr:tryptophan synthase subunit alpha [Alphaproteobacteria bacterium]MCB9931582.1 tryptophan synthase subunit alpha [Alphaproteobacteria bacterium]
MSRLAKRFADLKSAGRTGFVGYISAGDPDGETSFAILKGLPGAGVDVIELGVPFTDPAADGPAVQAAGQRALKAGISLRKVLAMVRRFREQDQETPIVLMGYFNPIYIYGCEAFSRDAAAAGVDGLITVDLPPEEDAELREPATAAGLDIIRLTAPTTDDARLPKVVGTASGFIYHVSITGITGTKSPTVETLRPVMERLRRHTDLPIAIGFGVKTPEQAREIGALGDAVVVGSAIVNAVAAKLDADGKAQPGLVDHVLALVRQLADGAHGA